MTQEEADRGRILQDYAETKISLCQAAKQLGVSYRQAKRLWARYKSSGMKGIVSQKRGKPSNRKLDPQVHRNVVSLIRENYPDFGPTLATEKLKKCHKISLSKETVRQVMIQVGIWSARQPKRKVYQRRLRRASEGELALMDASDHDWPEERGPRCSLHVIVDDATGKITAGHFEKEECTAGYMRACMDYFVENGVPRSFYVDRHGVFKVNAGNSIDTSLTQFGRAMKELGIGLIYALSPQAKGRVERAFGTLQDRLVKELRLQKINTIEAANDFLKSFLTSYNEQFAKPARSFCNVHRKLERDLKYVLCSKEKRVVSKNLEVSYEGVTYQIAAEQDNMSLKRADVTMITTLEGQLFIEYKGKLLKYKKYSDTPAPIKEVSIDELLKMWKKPRGSINGVSNKHPWKRGYAA